MLFFVMKIVQVHRKSKSTEKQTKSAAIKKEKSATMTGTANQLQDQRHRCTTQK